MEGVGVLARCGWCDFINYENIVTAHVRNVHANHNNISQETYTNDCEEIDNEHDYAEQSANEENVNEENANHHQWGDSEVKLLLSLYEKFKSDLENKKVTNRSVWKRISTIMNENNINVTWEQCDNKFKNLKKIYKKIVDNNSKTGRGRITFKYFDLLDNILSKNPEVHPLSEASSMGSIVNSPNLNSPSTSRESTPGIEKTLSREGTPTRPTRKRQQRNNTEPIWFKKFREDTEQRHDERMKMQERFISVMEKFLDKNN